MVMMTHGNLRCCTHYVFLGNLLIAAGECSYICHSIHIDEKVHWSLNLFTSGESGERNNMIRQVIGLFTISHLILLFLSPVCNANFWHVGFRLDYGHTRRHPLLQSG